MGKMTREQVEKINSKMHNNFIFDLRHYMMVYSEKQAIKNVDIDENSFYKATLYNEKNRQGENTVELNVSKYLKSSGEMYSSFGFGKTVTLAKGLKNKRFSDVQKITEFITDEYIISLAEANNRKLENAIILDADGWHL